MGCFIARGVRATLAVSAVLMMGVPGSAVAAPAPPANADAMRAGIRGGVTENTADAEFTLDSAVLAGFLRIRAGVGLGAWPDPRGGRVRTAPRLVASVLFFGTPLRQSWRPYAGTGTAQSVPGDTLFVESVATQFVAGVERAQGRWTVAIEGEADVSENLDRRRITAGDLWSWTPRIGIAIRRRF